MALTDINFNEGEGQDFSLLMNRGNGGVLTDVVVEPSGSQFPVEELTAETGGGDIFIIND